jgi:hypothetical protein
VSSSALPGNSALQNKALTVVNNTFFKNNPESIPAARKLADEVLWRIGRSTVQIHIRGGGAGVRSSAIVTSTRLAMSRAFRFLA